MNSRRTTLLTTLAGVAAIIAAAYTKSPCQLLYNPSQSAPRGWYLLMPAREVRIDDVVLADLPTSASAFAAARGYLPLHVPILKPIAARPGQKACARGHDILIDGRIVARALELDGIGRPLPRWNGCRMLEKDELFLLSHHSSASFDSRYFGPIQERAVRGKVIALWTW